MTATDIEIRALAEAVVDVLEERGLLPRREESLGRVLNVADVARLLGRSRGWVYEHSAELGAFRYASGPKARIGFDREAIERWKRDRRTRKAATTAAPARGRPRMAAAAAADLIPYEPALCPA
jgi:hypothetical protein